MKKLISAWLLAIVLIGCASVKGPLHEPRVGIMADSINKFDGIYNDAAIETGEEYYLLFRAFSFPLIKPLVPIDHSRIRIHFIDSKHVQFDFMDDSVTVAKRFCKGRLKDSYFYLNRHIWIHPVFMIWPGIESKKTRFCLVEGHLLVETKKEKRKFLFFTEEKSYKFHCKKLK